MKRLIAIITLGFFLVLYACVEPVDLVIEHQTKIVVISQDFMPGDPINIMVAKTRPLFSEGNQFINDADVQIFGDGKFLSKLSPIPNNEGQYGGNIDRIIPMTGVDYSITVEVPDLPTVRASSRIPEMVPIKRIDVENVQEEPLDGDQIDISYKVKVLVDDPIDKQNFYQITFSQILWNYSILGRDTILFPFPDISDPTVVQSNVSDPIGIHPDGGAMIKDDLFNGTEKAFEFEVSTILSPRLQLLGQLVIELRTVSDAYYQYYSSLSRQSQSSSSTSITAFDEPSSVFSNVENGLGLFAGYSFDLKAVNIK